MPAIDKKPRSRQGNEETGVLFLATTALAAARRGVAVASEEAADELKHMSNI